MDSGHRDHRLSSEKHPLKKSVYSILSEYLAANKKPVEASIVAMSSAKQYWRREQPDHKGAKT